MGYLYSDIKVNNSSTAFPPSFPNFTFPQWYQVIQAQNLILFASHIRSILLIFSAIIISVFISFVPPLM